MDTAAVELGESVRNEFYKFLTEFGKEETDDPALPSYSTYQTQCLDLLNRGSGMKTVRIDYSDLDDYNLELAEVVVDSFLRVESFLNQALRKTVMELSHQSADDFMVAFFNLRNVECLRGLRGDHVGQLTSFAGRVTRTGEVRPELFLASFTCANCGAMVTNVEQEFKLTMPTSCSNTACTNKRNFSLVKELSTLIDWQRIRVQEDNDEIPAGSLPRTMEVIIRGEEVEKIRPGDFIVFTGTLIAVPDVSVISSPGERVTNVNKKGMEGTTEALTGLSFLGVRELTYRLSFLACSDTPKANSSGSFNIREENVTQESMVEECTEEQLDEIHKMAEDPHIYRNLAQSIAANICGSEDIKKSILLMLVGGLHKTTNKEGIHLRGDINILIVGDASCGKSQFLKYVASLVPRAVYVSGKSSSAAGLTASVIKDSESAEFCIQAGALMLADNSICCIDEFDKMDQKDQVAIHEAMEQQTISISKAGIQATMNSRASILAAANPHSGRYDKNLTLRRNVALSAPLLSRFDLLHIMVDEPEEAKDERIGHHITRVHRALFIHDEEETFEAPAPPYTKAQMQLYIKYIRTIKPKLTPQATALITESYVKLRQLDTNPGSKASYRITTRQLEALIRLSEALARIYCSNAILSSHVKEAARLIENSVNTLSTPDVELEDLEEGPSQPQQNGASHFRQATLPETMEEDIMQTSSAVPLRDASETASEKIDLATYETVKRVLVRILRQKEEEEEGEEEEIGMTQNELLKQYFREQLLEVNLEPHEISAKMVIIQKLLAMFIFKDNILIILSTPPKQGGESEEAYEIRKRKERVLAVHPNYTEAH